MNMRFESTQPRMAAINVKEPWKSIGKDAALGAAKGGYKEFARQREDIMPTLEEQPWWRKELAVIRATDKRRILTEAGKSATWEVIKKAPTYKPADPRPNTSENLTLAA